MDARLEDRAAIADLMTGWMHRDLSEWDQLRALFHPGATIAITWFDGSAADFVEGSARMGASDLRSKHVITSPSITFNGDRALVQTNAMIIAENTALELGATAHNRFLDQVEKRDGVWRISRRDSSYDMSCFTFLTKVQEIDEKEVRRFPREYAALAYLLEKSGFPIVREFPTRDSALEAGIKAAGTAWLGDA
ncbi:nuclear transport factor 2 family protein [Streptantibioticus silvisoli]|uniref:Nuclear transport factor 2 family protein n=1 Tax=Streptantibioticus silvisoli TaxID=2705255 RepID=A0ABT6VY59_9ACTN|nr:nuclear transport factor 2 family protein [Streptantibioticus silvisoli]MDI5963384.1 nuclear transport factor 2 family protein [Streptantibioticus silvisoli]